MDRRRPGSEGRKWCGLIASLAFLATIRGATCRSSERDRFLVLVSTLDGRLTALESGTGAEAWSINTGTGPLLSSSITNLEINRDGTPVRLIPSLDGSLYQYDGSGIEPVPLAAEVLLSNSFRFGPDSTVVGGKEVESYGIDVTSGRLKYVCSVSGCQYFTPKSSNDSEEATGSETLVVTRHTKTVRAVEMKSGHEKWNFSVSQHEVTYVKSDDSNLNAHRADRKHQLPEADTYQYQDSTNEDGGPSIVQTTSYTMDDLHFKVIVPSGMVVAVLKKNPERTVWQQQFGVAIANAWLLNDGSVQEMDLFDNANVPALSVDTSHTIRDCGGDDQSDRDSDEAVLYVGVYDNQVYVQPSYSLQQQVHEATTHAVITGESNTMCMPYVRWKPYLATAPSRTPFMSQRGRRQIDGEVIDETTKALIPRRIDYPFDEGADEGVYLLQERLPPIRLGEDRQIADESLDGGGDGDSHFMQVASVWEGLFALTALTVFASVLIHFMLFKPRAKCEEAEESSPTKPGSVIETGASRQNIDHQPTGSATKAPAEYVSRYYSDFEQLAVLGHGGFGVVFEARNKLDDCLYAIKRIALNSSDHAKSKVMREVKALAKLDHAGIVRYHQSWFESPPMGWQEERDKACLEMPSSGYSVTNSTTTVSRDLHDVSICRLSQLYLSSKDPLAPLTKLDHRNPLKPFLEEAVQSVRKQRCREQTGTASSSDNSQRRAVLTDEFEPEPSCCECGDTWPQERNTHWKRLKDEPTSADSFSITFCRDLSSGTGSMQSTDCQNPGLPSCVYDISSSHERLKDLSDRSDSFDIVFADSGVEGGSATKQGCERGCSSAVIDISDSVGQLASSGQDGHLRVGVHRGSSVCAAQASRPRDLALNSTEGQRDGRLYLYIQMQLCRRESLKDWLAANTMDREQPLVFDIFHQIVSAVDYVHDKGLMHRDLKPSNIFFSMDGIVKIGDFGLVTALEETVPTPYDDQTSGQRRHTGQVGTTLYMSPEQHAGRHYTHKVDIYALGLIFFELMYPFSTQMERVKTLVDVKRLRFPDRFVQKLSKDEVNFIGRLLSHDPDQRPSCRDILDQPMLAPFEQVHKAYAQARARSSSRIHTSSTSSNHSGSGSGCQ